MKKFRLVQKTKECSEFQSEQGEGIFLYPDFDSDHPQECDLVKGFCVVKNDRGKTEECGDYFIVVRNHRKFVKLCPNDFRPGPPKFIRINGDELIY